MSSQVSCPTTVRSLSTQQAVVCQPRAGFVASHLLTSLYFFPLAPWVAVKPFSFHDLFYLDLVPEESVEQY